MVRFWICYYFKETEGDGATEEEVIDMIGNATDLTLADIVSTGFKTVDGRILEESLFTPGGDSGEFILAL